VRELLDEHDIRLTKSLGQNFVIDPNTIRKVVELAHVQPGDKVLEVGAGAGSLTIGLAAAGAEVTALEIDERLLPILEETTRGLSVDVVHQDAMTYDFSSVSATTIVANLPYNIAATLVLKILEEAPAIQRLTVMTQREVSERLAAAPGSKTYGLSTVLAGYWATARLAGTVSRNAFFPVPNVDSALVELTRHDKFESVDYVRFKQIAKAAFGQRRKMLRASLAPLQLPPGCFEAADIDPTARAEELPVASFARLSSVC
jgi:16S rRNA (adenine1518-N6/adenine1519-N6)-dimethyltransferase